MRQREIHAQELVCEWSPRETVPSGLAAFDALTGGWRKKDLSMIVGHPGSGVEDFITEVRTQAALDGYHVPMLDGSESPMPAFVERVRALHDVRKVDMLIIDRVNLLVPADPRELVSREVELAVEMRRLASDLNIHIMMVGLVDVAAIMSRSDKRPLLSDTFPEEMESTVDLMIALYRDETYHPATNDRGVAELIVLKSRFCPIQTVKVKAVARPRLFFSDLP